MTSPRPFRKIHTEILATWNYDPVLETGAIEKAIREAVRDAFEISFEEEPPNLDFSSSPGIFRLYLWPISEEQGWDFNIMDMVKGHQENREGLNGIVEVTETSLKWAAILEHAAKCLRAGKMSRPKVPKK